MILNAGNVTRGVFEQGMKMAEEVFQTESHPDQMQVSRENFEKLKALDSNTILYDVADNFELKGWIVSVPTSKILAELFLNKELSEQELLDESKRAERYDALYLCAVGVSPKFRRQGIASRLIKEAVSRMPMSKDYEAYIWLTTTEGEALTHAMAKEMGKVVHLRK